MFYKLKTGMLRYSIVTTCERPDTDLNTTAERLVHLIQTRF